MTYSAIIVDDELMARNLLNDMISMYCPEIEVIALCKDLPEAVKAIAKNKPSLVFLDIEMPGYSGMDIFDFFDEDAIDFSIIFVTAYNNYAIQAFKLSAVDYILKPIESDDLITAVSLFVKKSETNRNKYKVLKSNLKQDSAQRIALNTMNSVSFVNLNDILFFQAEGAYTKIVLQDGKVFTQSKGLKSFEYITVSNSQFIRCHKSYIVNLHFVTDFVRKDGGYLIVNHVYNISVSSEKTADILEKIATL
jgi:two-component system LytT family response regulator